MCLIGPTSSRNSQFRRTCYMYFVLMFDKHKRYKLYLFNVFHAMQELTGDGVQLEQIHAIEGALQQLKDGGKLE